MKIGKWVLAVLVGVLAVAVAIRLVVLLQDGPDEAAMHTYFTYTAAEREKLRDLQPTGAITPEDVYEWENKAFEQVEVHGSSDVDASKVYAYLMVAQNDVVALSRQLHGTSEGNIAIVSKKVLCEIYADTCSSLRVYQAPDAYSDAVAELIVGKMRQRMLADAQQTKPYELKTGAQYWNGPSPQIGLEAGNFKPWLLRSGSQFRAEPPPNAQIFQEQLEEVKQLVQNATNQQKATVVQWAGGPGTKTPPGQWLDAVSYYMLDTSVPLSTFLETRAALSMSMADAVIAVFDSKYFYQQKRPFMLDPSLVTTMPTPNHPSYPAGHAAISWAAATVASHYLPGNTQEWERLAHEASVSRSIGGIHFSVDNTAGEKLGKNVAQEGLKNW